MKAELNEMTTSQKIETKTVKLEEAIMLREAKFRFNDLGIGLVALANASGYSVASASKYMNGLIPEGAAKRNIGRALCRILQVDGIVYPGE